MQKGLILILCFFLVSCAQNSTIHYQEIVAEHIKKEMHDSSSFSFKEFRIDNYNIVEQYESKISSIENSMSYIFIKSRLKTIREFDSLDLIANGNNDDYKSIIQQQELKLKPFDDLINACKDSIEVNKNKKIGKRMIFEYSDINPFGDTILKHAEAYFNGNDKLIDLIYND